MSQRLPVELNIVRLCAENAGLSGVLPLRHFKRLEAYLQETPAGDLEVELGFTDSPEPTKLGVRGGLKGSLSVECHRCGLPMPLLLDAHFDLVFVRGESDWEGLGGDRDAFELDESGMVRSVDLLEDELILQIPLAPRHAESETCAPAEWREAATGDSTNVAENGRDNPFSVLKKLK